MKYQLVSALRRALRDYGSLGDLICERLTIALTPSEGDALKEECCSPSWAAGAGYVWNPCNVGDRGTIMGIRFVIVPEPVCQPPALDIDHD